MASIVVQSFISLDGVMQGPGGPDEDREGGFSRGGWVAGIALGDNIRDWERNVSALLLGRKTYDIWVKYWPLADESDGLLGELAQCYNRVPKFVASRTLVDVEWNNARLLRDDLAEDVRELRDKLDGEIRVWGSSELIRTLAAHDLVDEYRLMHFPVALGEGKRLFPDGFPYTHLRLVETRALSSGVVVTVYRRATADTTQARDTTR